MTSRSYIRVRLPFDILTAACALLLLSPVLVTSAILIKLDGGPVFFRQPRLGLDARTFHIWKFRTMMVNADDYLDEHGMPTRPRITPVGKYLRKFSIDELPQFFNILTRDMNLIGPRPILPDMFPYMTTAEKLRFDVKPGISGWAQVLGRNSILWSKRFELDCEYIESASISLDLKIVVKTILLVVGTSNISQDRNATEVNDVKSRTITIE